MLTTQALPSDATELRSGDERFTIVPRNPGFTVWDWQHNVERGLYFRKRGARRRIDELTGRISARRAPALHAEDLKPNYPSDAFGEE